MPRHFDGGHLTLPGASNVIRLYEHQKRVIWGIIAAGSTYIAQTVGAGKTFSIAAAVMEQKRLGLITKAMWVVPGHCLAQAGRNRHVPGRGAATNRVCQWIYERKQLRQ